MPALHTHPNMASSGRFAPAGVRALEPGDAAGVSLRTGGARPAGRGILAALALSASLLGCGAPDAPSGKGTPAPDVAVLSLEGDTVHLSSFHGAPVLLNLWATWCEPCKEEAPYLQQIAEKYVPRGLRMIGLSEDPRGSELLIKSFVKQYGMTYTILNDPTLTVMDRYAILGLPTTLLMDREGIIRYVTIGPASPRDPNFERTIEALLQ